MNKEENTSLPQINIHSVLIFEKNTFDNTQENDLKIAIISMFNDFKEEMNEKHKNTVERNNENSSR